MLENLWMAWKISASAPHGTLHISKVELKYKIEGWKWKHTQKAFANLQCGAVILGKKKKKIVQLSAVVTLWVL